MVIAFCKLWHDFEGEEHNTKRRRNFFDKESEEVKKFLVQISDVLFDRWWLCLFILCDTLRVSRSRSVKKARFKNRFLFLLDVCVWKHMLYMYMKNEIFQGRILTFFPREKSFLLFWMSLLCRFGGIRWQERQKAKWFLLFLDVAFWYKAALRLTA